jgi:SAM-dependent methyltransferase
MTRKTRADLIAIWQAEETEPFAGWDFSHLDGRMIDAPLPWDYGTLAADRLDHATTVLDLDTGGGERLLALSDHWPATVVATEGYPPNVALARSRLTAAGATLVDLEMSDDVRLPFADASFDLVLNRHGAFPADEVARVLRPGGIFLTQQVHGRSLWDLHARFGVSPPWPHITADYYVPKLTAAGLQITLRQENWGKVRFMDVGALVYFLKAVPWEVPGFAVARHLDVLLSLQDELEQTGELTFNEGRYLLEARKVRSAV